MNVRESKKGSDKRIDGTTVFVDDTSGRAKRVIVEVNRHLHNPRKPSRDMTTEAVGKGFHHSEGWNKDYPNSKS